MKIISVFFLTAALFLSAQTMSTITYKEVLAAKEFYDSGAVGKAGSVLDLLIRDKDPQLAEQAWILRSELFGNVFFPPQYTTCLIPEFEEFAKKHKKSGTVKEIEKNLRDRSEGFIKKLRSQNTHTVMLFSDSCIVNYGQDSSFFFSFDRNFTGTDRKEHNIKFVFSGKLRSYQPYADMQDEWGSTGLIINTDGNIFIELDGRSVFAYDSPLSVKQYPEYVLRKVTKYGFTQDQTFIKEDDSAAMSRLAFQIDDRSIISDLNLRFLFGKMNDLVPYYSDTNERIFPDKFGSKAYIELKLDQMSD